MNLVINSQILASELRVLNKVAPTKAAVPIFSYVLITADRERPQAVQLYATDLEIGLHTQCPAQVQMPGTAALPVARLLAMVEHFRNADVTLTLEGGQMQITCEAFQSRLQTLPTTDFPLLPEVSGPTFPLNAPELRRLIQSTRYAVSDKAGRYFLQGGLLTLAGQTAALITTDGKRLALATMSRIGEAAQAILPVKTLDLLALQTDLGDVQFTIGDRHLFFVGGGRTVISRRLEGTFPNYERIIPRDNPHQAKVDRLALSAALRRVGLIAEETQDTAFAFTPGSNGASGALELSASTANVGQASERMTVTYEGAPFTVHVSWQSVLEMLDVAAAPMLTMQLKDEKTALLLLDGDHHLAVVLPMSGQG
jgi:DNA polymerase-3 subunit beta